MKSVPINDSQKLAVKNYHSGRKLLKKKSSFNKGIKQLESSAKAGYVWSALELICQALNGGYSMKPKEIFKALSHYESLGHFGAYVNLGFCYEHGIGIKKDFKMAFKFYKKAADLVNVIGQYNVACFYENGIGTRKNIKKAVFWYFHSAKNGYPDAINTVGCLYLDGIGVNQDFKKAKYYFLKAIKLKNAPAHTNLGIMYRDGDGVRKNLKKAKDLFRKGKKMGSELSAELLEKI